MGMYTYTKCFFNVEVATPGSRMDLSYIYIYISCFSLRRKQVLIQNLNKRATTKRGGKATSLEKDNGNISGGNQPLCTNYGNFDWSHTMLIQGKTYRRWEG
jgi:hypothetical protein